MDILKQDQRVNNAIIFVEIVLYLQVIAQIVLALRYFLILR
jgi:hypothetical protein